MKYFSGNTQTPSGDYTQLPIIEQDALTTPKDYIAGTELSAAVNVALNLGMPLLLTGEPGCGKSELARRIAWELEFPRYGDNYNGQYLKYTVKSTTEARDLFYNYDTLGHFYAAHHEGKEGAKSARDFIRFQALGLALLRAKGKSGTLPEAILTNELLASLPDAPHRSVVLIDEIDKAPRDVPNDILNEIEHLEFSIPELQNIRIGLDGDELKQKPVVIITSNSERDLPPAFLRRCVYYHVPFPPFQTENPEEVSVEKIVQSRLGKRFNDWSKIQHDALALCQHLRQDHHNLIKPPGIAEILNFLSYLSKVLENSPELVPNPQSGLKDIPENLMRLAIKTTLLKNRDDQNLVSTLWNSWE